MRPYTTTTKDPENLRKNWRENRNYWRKSKDMAHKKSQRQAFKREVFSEYN